MEYGHRYLFHLIQRAEHIKSSEGVEHHLGIVVCRDFNPLSVLEVDDMQVPVGDDDAVSCPRTFRYIRADIQALFKEYQRIFLSILLMLQCLEDECGIFIGTAFHFLIVVVQGGSWVIHLDAKGKFDLVLA
ncbi:hypothetical protein SDC9_53937 [bioreactor metagenome]|uniref:Uncharacterized protein n=1 Tax=bioreactor metagenome TaxID=1076179 RepID=A0A644WUS2_9ZZZZ